jgi:hypothetical protein
VVGKAAEKRGFQVNLAFTTPRSQGSELQRGTIGYIDGPTPFHRHPGSPERSVRDRDKTGLPQTDRYEFERILGSVGEAFLVQLDIKIECISTDACQTRCLTDLIYLKRSCLPFLPVTVGRRMGVQGPAPAGRRYNCGPSPMR